MHLDDEELQPKELKKVRRGMLVLGVCLWRAEEGGPGSSRIKRRWWVSLLRRVLWWTGVRRSTHLRNNFIPTKRRTAPLLEYQRRTIQKKDEAALEEISDYQVLG
jgi:hypothetical protein